MLRGNSVLFSPTRIGSITLKNKFMRSATYEGLGSTDEKSFGDPRQELLNMMVELSRNDVGLIVPGFSAVSRRGMFHNDMNLLNKVHQAEKWTSAIEEIHKNGSKLFFQLCFCSDQKDDTDGRIISVSSFDPKSQRELSQADIDDLITMYSHSAYLAKRAGADGIQLHCAHKQILSHFLSPSLNHRSDKYGGSTENRVRIVKEIINEIKSINGKEFPVTIKMNGNDYIPDGVTPEIAAEHVHHLINDVDMFEISCSLGGKMNSARNIIHEKSLFHKVPKNEQEGLLKAAKELTSPFFEAFNLDSCKVIREKNPNATISLVGGLRNFSKMEEVVNSGLCNIVSMSRPFLQDPAIVRKFKEGTKSKSGCINCSSCLLKMKNGVYCHYNEVNKIK
ncbi:NADPH dehydrogenase [Tritrichomonas foetus]|uniref:NADPH dehydrogenase n=1 Tax=Tritrichomonas foetus TaxID=1144522 RepID=A0A1J4J8Z2_9EUKA|nr:NADPH dehydrogenase [Tritrichomonas foetus]|eukprot:OHS93692.1 NADPH dehydrogenase [Tritrichomonas foetus]